MHCLLCYKPNMRKWMRERLQRRKKNAPGQAAEAAPPPLQPAYFDEGSNSAPVAEPAPSEATTRPVTETQSSADGDSEGPPSSSAPRESARNPAAQKPSPRARARRRRGGRGRSGRGREQAVAQAFSHAATKGSAPVVAEEEQVPEALQAEVEASATPARVETPKLPSAPAAAPRPSKGAVVLAIGLPGSGKSSWFKRHNVVPLSSDALRALLFDDVREQRYQDIVFSNLRSLLKARLIARRPMNYVDATNLTPQERQHWIKLAKDYNYEVHAVFFDVPLEVCIERHQRRDRVVPEEMMRRMAAKLKPPSFDEGFAKITVVRVKKKA